jgi:probable F420-dependent oxidoreductase
MALRGVGIWTGSFGVAPRALAQETAAELEQLGYSAIWVPEAFVGDPFVTAALLLQATQRITLATGIANIWLRMPQAMVSAQRSLLSAFPDRFVLGLGVSHGPMVEGFLRQSYDRPLEKMRTYLEAMESVPAMGFSGEAPRVLAALRRRMLALAREKASGAHPYFVPVEHTVRAREVLGPGPILAPEQAVVLETDAAKARQIGRGHMSVYLNLPNYVNNLLSLGWTQDDVGNGGSDKLVDAIVAWGDVDRIAARVKAHRDAGAGHVSIQALEAEFRTLPLRQWRELAPALTSA